jgi:glycosyltransferase involved in cell wall biosynthesis
MVFVGQNGPFTEALVASGIPFRSLQHLKRPIHPLEDYRAVLEIRNRLLAFSPDLVACHSSKAGWLGRIAAKMAGVPAVFTVHGWTFTDGVSKVKRTVYKWAESLAAPLARRIITVSDCDRQLAIQSGVVKPHQVVTVLNGIPDTPAKNAAGDF